MFLIKQKFNLYHTTGELSRTLANIENYLIEFLPVLGTINNYEHIIGLLKRDKVQTVYHAAAYRHVLIVEAQPEQGLEKNVFGTMKVVDAAIEAGAENCMLVSSDKAVRPTKSMGATKRIAELVLHAKVNIHTHIKISMVRFGYLLASSGSVVPKFEKQIEQGGPITLTDPNITRYFMTIPEAAQLVSCRQVQLPQVGTYLC